MECSFCKKDKDLSDRIFYENKENGWFAFISADPLTKGHSILAAPRRGEICPKFFDFQMLRGLDIALCEAVRSICEFYQKEIKDILLASLRGDIKHFHFHLLPLWPEEEGNWREVTGYSKAHLMEFLGSLEKKQDFLFSERSVDEEKKKVLRMAIKSEHLGEIRRLRQITGYDP
jgi:diadenosine tetraphosphate (Ap4A) HIT family hydrolase